ncbi:hypothetical protein BC826DRAFT_299037 [Russula brevipes]|nr:hypothetical protein BC826DRAFT_299037 [Russula brevipes]
MSAVSLSAASLSAAYFASPVGYLGSSESTPYYPTGDLQDRNIAFTNAMVCVDHLEDYLHGNDDVRIATKFFELAQALSDLGLHEYALNTSGFALDTVGRLCTAAPDDSRLHLASILSLRSNILYDLKRNDEARDTADRAVSLCKEPRDSQTPSWHMLCSIMLCCSSPSATRTNVRQWRSSSSATRMKCSRI